MESSASFVDLVRDWRDFYALLGTASATLVGLLFVAASIGASTFREEHRDPLGSFLTPTVVHFSVILFASILACVPSQSWRSLGGFLGAGALGGLAYSARIFYLIVVARRFKVDVGDRLFYAAIPMLGYVVLAVAATLLFLQSPLSADIGAAALLILLFAGIRNAWDMTVWTATKSPPATASPDSAPRA
jgi:hypothetical protein